MRTLYVNNLPYSMDAAGFEAFFNKADFYPTRMLLMHHPADHARYPGKFKGCGLAEFATDDECERAEHYIRDTKPELNGRLIYAQPSLAELRATFEQKQGPFYRHSSQPVKPDSDEQVFSKAMARL